MVHFLFHAFSETAGSLVIMSILYKYRWMISLIQHQTSKKIHKMLHGCISLSLGLSYLSCYAPVCSCYIFIVSHNSVSQSVTVRSRKISLWAQTEKVLLLVGGGVQINNGNVIPWRARHPQVCLHLAYILVMTVFPTPIFFSLLQVHNLTISSTWGVSQQNSSTALTRTPSV